MQFGYFDDKEKEYVITNPDTPEPWSNYLGSTVYGAIITNNAGGYSFYKSAAQGRFMRFRTNTVEFDQPGRYLYIRDRDSGDYWSASWQPVGKPLHAYKTICRHGTAYTIIESEYGGIKSETCYFVPPGEEYECWHCRISNTGKTSRRLRLFTFVEYASNWNLWMDLINLQYTQYILTMQVNDGIIDQGTNVYLPPQPDNFEEGGQARHTFLGVSGVEIRGYDTDRKKFIGSHRSYSNPVAVEKGECSNSLASGDNGCGTLQFDIDLKPGELKEFVVVMGIGSANHEGKDAVKACSDINQVKAAFNRLKQYWHNRLQGLTAITPDADFNSMINMWNPYNCLMTYAWSRAASLVYAGERDGLGYRDSVQDLLGVMHIIPDEAKKRLELMITGQTSAGGAMPVVRPFSHKPGKETPPKEEEYRSDDCMWLFNTIPAYVNETGDTAFYSSVLPYADKGEDTVLGHMRMAIGFSLQRSGIHGLPCGLSADWNDCLVLGQKGESVFVAFQLRYALKTYIDISRQLNLKEEQEWAAGELKKLDDNIEKHAWDGEWYLRAYRHDGLKYGAKADEEGSLWLNPQTWAVLSGHADKAVSEKIMDHVNKRLATEYGLVIIDPPYKKADLNVIKAPLFNAGMKENGAIFCHIQGWAVMAEAMLGHGNRAYQYYHSFLPAAYNDKAGIREIEPYVYSQSTHGKTSARYGASRLPWLTGAATWAYYSACYAILGLKPVHNGMIIDPCIPARWDGFTMNRRFRGKELRISVENPGHVEQGVKQIMLNRKAIPGNFIPADELLPVNEISVVMGK
jgi:N,N'-diacetylchitobiose phosphorylase